ncbi:MAG: nucleotide exchange factor GrpE [Firmicutes bacterium]|nr:nucleotide exchange factor GrpE [Bacillota bacterium]MCL2771629.1 nucleotide exchange factor GrpE [Bacillota bacterium]
MSKKKDECGCGCEEKINCGDDCACNPVGVAPQSDPNWEDVARRTMADFHNYKVQQEARRKDLAVFSTIAVVEKFLPTMDAIEKAMAVIVDKKAAEGMNAIMENMKATLAGLGIREIDSKVGTVFNADFHNAIMATEDKKAKPNTILETYQTGYELHGKVIRYSMVRVSK